MNGYSQMTLSASMGSLKVPMGKTPLPPGSPMQQVRSTSSLVQPSQQVIMASPTYRAPTYVQPVPTVQHVVQQQQPTYIVQQDTGGIEHVLQIINEERNRHLAVESQLRAEIEQLKNRVSSLEVPQVMAIPQESELERRIREIELRGNVRIDWQRGLVEVLREIGFVPRRTTESPDAELANPSAACFIFDDVAEAAGLVGGTVTVEGHTRGGESDFWQALAMDRARLVGKALIDRGIDQNRIVTRGMPGKRGLNKVAVLIHLDHCNQLRQSSSPLPVKGA